MRERLDALAQLSSVCLLAGTGTGAIFLREEPFLWRPGDVNEQEADRAADTAQTLGARAFTLGHDIVLGEGQYAPGRLPGNTLLAHELVHVMQQSGAASRRSWAKQHGRPSVLHEGARGLRIPAHPRRTA